MQRLFNAIIFVWCLALASIIILISSCGLVHAETPGIPENLAVRAILGEASGEGLNGMLCVASAIRNRGSLEGVYGLHARHVDKQPKWVWRMARKAWRMSAHKDYSCGASFWEGTAFKTPYWAKDMELVKTVGNQRFYKPNKKR